MLTMKLVHPEFGLCVQQEVFGPTSANKVKRQWKYRYGKKFNECTVEIENDEVVEPDNDILFVKPEVKHKVTEEMIHEVFRLTKIGKERSYIGRKLGISVDTVTRIRNNKKDKTGAPYYTIST